METDHWNGMLTEEELAELLRELPRILHELELEAEQRES